MNVRIYDLENEKLFISSLLRFPEAFADIDGTVDENDFVNKMHQIIFSVIRQTLRSGENLDKVVVSQKINNLGLSFEDKVDDILSYLTDLSLIPVSWESIKDIANSLKAVTMRRSIAETAQKIANEMQKMGGEVDRVKILHQADLLYNDKIEMFQLGQNAPENITESIEDYLNQTQENEGVYTIPGHDLQNKMYGGILRNGNITVIAARSGCGKTTLLNSYCYKICKEDPSIKICHLDFGEMSANELRGRILAAESGVPLYFIESRKYLQNPEMVALIKIALPKIKAQQFFYYNVAGCNVDQIISIIRRFYLSKVGRNQGKAIVCLDYIKSSGEVNSQNRAEYEVIGRLLTKLKDAISGPNAIPVPILSATQLNRSGIVGHKGSNELIDDESTISGSDRISYFSSFLFLLRKKSFDEIAQENKKFGSHVLVNLKSRFMGEDMARAIKWVKMSDGKYRMNRINIEIDNFATRERGDLIMQEAHLNKLKITKPINTSDVEL